MKLELRANKQDLEYHQEFTLNTKPITIDLLVITKSKDAIIANETWKYLKGHNIFEYKSPDDSLNIDTFHKAMGYANLYKAGGARVNAIDAGDITISLVRRRYPRKLIKDLLAEGASVELEAKGIYRVTGNYPFEIRIIVSRDLEPAEHIWLASLTDNITMQVAEDLVDEISGLTEKDDKEFGDSVLQVAIAENEAAFEKIKEASEMCEALRELFKPELEAAVATGRLEGRAEKITEYAQKITEYEEEINSLKARLAVYESEKS